MKKFLCLLFVFSFFCISAYAGDYELIKVLGIQKSINDVGVKILNSNRIEKRIIFVYSKKEKKGILKSEHVLGKKQVVVYADAYKSMANYDEIAAYLAREAAIVSRSYDGIFKGSLRSLQMKAAPKKFEIVADKTAVDYMVNAGFNPIGLITYLNKTCPQKKYDLISTKNLTSKRLATIYEYIYTKYPYFLVNNEYQNDFYYQNFLLTSQNNRRKLEKKIKSDSDEAVKYE